MGLVAFVLADGVAGGTSFGATAPGGSAWVIAGATDAVDDGVVPVVGFVALPDAVDAALGEGVGWGDGQIVLTGEVLNLGLEAGDEVGEGLVAVLGGGGESAAAIDGAVAEAVGWASPTWPHAAEALAEF